MSIPNPRYMLVYENFDKIVDAVIKKNPADSGSLAALAVLSDKYNVLFWETRILFNAKMVADPRLTPVTRAKIISAASKEHRSAFGYEGWGYEPQFRGDPIDIVVPSLWYGKFLRASTNRILRIYGLWAKCGYRMMPDTEEGAKELVMDLVVMRASGKFGDSSRGECFKKAAEGLISWFSEMTSSEKAAS